MLIAPAHSSLKELCAAICNNTYARTRILSTVRYTIEIFNKLFFAWRPAIDSIHRGPSHHVNWFSIVLNFPAKVCINSYALQKTPTDNKLAAPMGLTDMAFYWNEN